MTDNNTELENRIADVERRLTAHEGLRSDAIDALGHVSTGLAHLQDRVAVVTHPVLDEARERNSPALYARLSARMGAMEEWLRELTNLIIEDREIVPQLVALLKAQRRQLGDRP